MLPAEHELFTQLRDMDMIRLQRVGVYGSPQRLVVAAGGREDTG